MRRYRVLEARRGRWSFAVYPSSLNLPRISVGPEEDGEYLAFTYGNGSSDPVVMVEITLIGTRLGRLLRNLYWTVRR